MLPKELLVALEYDPKRHREMIARYFKGEPIQPQISIGGMFNPSPFNMIQQTLNQMQNQRQAFGLGDLLGASSNTNQLRGF